MIVDDQIAYRQCEILADSVAFDTLTDPLAANSITLDQLLAFPTGDDDPFSTSAKDSLFPNGLSLYRITSGSNDALAVVDQYLDNNDVGIVAPNYVVFGTPLWIYGPGDTPVGPTATEAPKRTTGGSGVKVGVVDSGLSTQSLPAGLYNGVATFSGVQSSPLVTKLPKGHLTDEVYTGYAAGHGTFIAGLIKELAPEAQVIVAQVLFAGDPDKECDDVVNSNPTQTGADSTWCTDETRLAVTIQELLKANSDLNYVNLSLGTFGGPPRPNEKGGMYPPPLALLHTMRAAHQNYPKLIIAAAAGNVDRTTPAKPATQPSSTTSAPTGPPLANGPFYPGAFANEGCFTEPVTAALLKNAKSWCLSGIPLSKQDPALWLLNVGSNATAAGKLYTNYGKEDGWVTVRAAGSDIASWRPKVDNSTSAGWWKWSGTSFATACVTGQLAANRNTKLDIGHYSTEATGNEYQVPCTP